MACKFPPIIRKLPVFMHGAGRRYPLDETREMQCHVRGDFSWSMLEPAEGTFHFEWLDRLLDAFVQDGIYAWLATPSGARLAWMSQKYPEVLRVGANGKPWSL